MADSSTREKLIAAGERLFADRGFAGASLREITREAGTNLAAVNYHFGSKEGLLRAVLEGRLGPICRQRLEHLEALESRGELSIEGLLEGFAQPLLDPALRPNQAFLHLMGRVHHSDHAIVTDVLRDIFSPVADRYVAALSTLLPEVPRGLCFQRLQFVVGALVHSLFTQCRVHAPEGEDAAGLVDDESFLWEFIGFCAAGLRRPPVSGSEGGEV